MGDGNWLLIFIKQGHNIYISSGHIFDICPSFCVTCLWSWQKHQLHRFDHQSHMGLIFTNRINSKSFPSAVCSAQERYVPKFSASFSARLDMIIVDGQHGLITSSGHGQVIMRNLVMHCNMNFATEHRLFSLNGLQIKSTVQHWRISRGQRKSHTL